MSDDQVSPRQIWNFYYTMGQTYEVLFFFHLAFGLAIILYVIYRYARKDPPSIFQLACLTSLSLGNIANCID